ncbi:MAG: hypothetical protein BAJALOKI2v1_1170002, partial [Promethearchaeota archaeon]
MPENLTPEEYAKKAIEMLEKAGRFDEEENNPTKAIDYYKKAAEYLERSGYMAHRVNDIRARIQELSTIIEQNQVYTQLEDQAQIDQLQLDAFNLLEKAKNLVNTTQIDSAINLYDQAILKLTKSGWAENQLISLIENRNKIAEKANMKKIDLKELGIDTARQEPGSKVQQEISIDSQEEIKRKKIETFKTKKQKEQETQNEAFRLIDEAKDYEKEKKYEDAIMNLEKSVRLLNSIGWSQQTKNIQKEIDRLKGEEEKYQRLQSQKQKSDNYLQDVLMKKLASEESEITKSTDLMDFEETKKNEERTQKEAFKLIDIGKELEREKKYQEAIQNFEEAIKLLHDINWDSYIQPIEDFISQIRIKKQREERLKSLREKREKEVSKVQESFKKKQKESFVQAAQQLEKNRIEFEKNRLKQIQKEQNFFNILNEADEDLKKGNHESALEKYKRSLEIIKTLGSGWESYIPKIEETIEKVKDRQDQILEEELEAQRRKEKRIEDEMDFQSTILQKLEEERQKIKEKELELKEKEEDKEKRNKLKEKAFKFIETAQEYTNQGNYERAIYAYRQASNLFAQIQWAEEIPIIEEAIESLERRKQKEKEEKEKELQEKIKKHKEEKEFQELISKSLKEEREKLRKREIALKQKEQEFANRQKKRDKAFNILSDAKNKLEEGNFNKAIDLYHDVANIFA